jgi:hypothetical protein
VAADDGVCAHGAWQTTLEVKSSRWGVDSIGAEIQAPMNE